MKIRNGFVSNSSSSSFLITGDYTTVEVAKEAVKMAWEEKPETIEKLIHNLDRLDNKDIPIYIEYGDDIIIYRLDNGIMFEGSNHVHWYESSFEAFQCMKYDDGLYDKKERGDLTYYFPKWDIKGKNAISQDHLSFNEWYCEKCHCNRIVHTSGKIFCPSCKTDPNGKIAQFLFREDKLERIIKNK